jgi:transcriptional regulator with XRE-family HTH domain
LRRIVSNMGTNAVQRDATAKTVSANVKRLRSQQNLGLRGLANKLGEVGRPLGHSAVDQIEKGKRRVDVDDLMALAAALDVSPATLLMPVGEKDEEATVTAHTAKLTCGHAWDWITARRPVTSDGPMSASLVAWWARSRPVWSIEITMHTPVVTVSNGND